MRQTLSLLIISGLFLSLISPIWAISVRESSNTSIENTPPAIVYPAGEDFGRLKSLIETNFVPKNGYQYNCIMSDTLCSTYRYTSVIEKAIKLIVSKTYVGNEQFYDSLFSQSRSYSSSSTNTIKNIIDRVPRGASLSDWKSLGFGNSIGGELLDASFGVNFTENANSSTMLGAIEQKIQEMKRTKCQKENTENDSYTLCPWNGVISNKYSPTQDELYTQTIYLNRGSVKIESLKDEIEYVVQKPLNVGVISPFPNAIDLNVFLDTTMMDSTLPDYRSYFLQMKSVRAIPTRENVANMMSVIKRVSQTLNRDNSSNANPALIQALQDMIGLQHEMEFYQNELEKNAKEISYTLRYKKESYTFEEAKAELEKKEVSNKEFLVTSNFIQEGEIPCRQYTGYLVRSQCMEAIAALKQLQTALAAYNIDNAIYPIDINKLSPYLPKFPQAITDNFSYKAITNTQGQPDYEIRYIGKIGEGTTGTGETTLNKDYKAMMSGATVPDIPQIFAHIPADSMVLYIRNPANLLDILNQKSNTSQRLSGIDVSESIRGFMKTFFELEKFDQIQKNLKHEMAIVVNNLDATAPDIVVILSESDRAALSPTAKARVVGSKDGYIYIASSKESLDQTMSLPLEKSLKNAPDFHYVWWKKSALVKDAMIFVGDAFFEKMLTLETYITHYRKYRDYTRLSSLQELVWAYGDAFAKSPTEFNELSTLGIPTLTGEVLAEYSIADGLVTHKNIGTLKSLKTLPEAHYDLSKISRNEIEDYKYNILQYRDIWRASLDPMGIVMNRYGDGMEIDFFMTPIPTTSDTGLMQMQQMFEGTTKDALSFVTNPRIRMGLVSFVLGFDPQKLQTKIKSNEEIGRGFEDFSKSILDGKNIFDYLGGEFAWSIGSLDPDIFEGWNVEKIDAYISVQVANETKGKELIEILKKKFLGEMNRGSSSVENSMFSMLAKPLIEDYQGKKIYYVEAIPVPWVGKIGIAYSFVDDFFIIGLNRSTIKHVIDTAVSGDIRKKSILTTDSFEKGTFFATLFDGKNTSQELTRLYAKNQNAIPQMLNNLGPIQSELPTLASTYYTTEDRSKRLGLPSVSLQYTLGSLTLSGTSDNLNVKIDPSKLTNLSGSALEMWKSIKGDPTFPSVILTEQGAPLDVFLGLKNVGDIISLNMIVQIDSALGGSESLLRNVTFGMNMGNDEIGFRLRVFRQQDNEKGETTFSRISSNVWMIGGLLLMLIVLGSVVGFIVYKRGRSVPIVPPIANTSPSITDSPLVVPSIILPTSMSMADTGDNVAPPEIVPVADTPKQSIDATLRTESAPVNPIPVVPEDHGTPGAPIDSTISHHERLPDTK